MSDLQARRSAMTKLADAIQSASLAAVLSEAPIEVLERATAIATALERELEPERRAPATLSSLDDLELGLRMFSPVTGTGNPFSLRLHLLAPGPDHRTVGTVTLTPQHEGHVGIAHGGIIAMLFDDILGTAAVRKVWPAVTGRLSVRYRHPVPIGTPLTVTAEVTKTDGRLLEVHATITAEGDPGRPLAEAEATFVELDRERAIAMLGSDVRRIGGTAINDPGTQT